MDTFSPLWSRIVDSSLWAEEDRVVKVFMTMMALKDADHVYRGTVYALATRSRKSESEVMEILKILAAPDTKRQEEQEFEGRRIKAVPDGWLLLNGEKYRKMMSEEMRRARNRRAQAAWRERHKGHPLPGENNFVKAANNGASEEELDRLSEPQPKK